ncbi:MAG: hypothetical protein LH472_07790 [Pyrinomonadaceae bacterium]|nr:hypothetical protein [Pyrinomonadaceae bacterium]
MSVQLEVTTENLLNAVAQMPEGEFNRFVEKATKLRRNGQSKKSVSPAEADLLHRINNIFSSEKRRRYNQLYAKFQDENIEKSEYEELLVLSSEFEMLNVERLKYIGELADLRGESLEQVMDFFEMKIPNDE